MDHTIAIEPINYTLNLVQLESLGVEYCLLMGEIGDSTGDHLEFTGLKGNLDAFKKTLANFKKVA